MRSIIKQPLLWCVVLIIVVLPVVAHVGSASRPSVKSSARHSSPRNEVARAHVTAMTKAITRHVAKPPQDRYDRRRQYWEDRVDRRLERRQEYLDGEVSSSKSKSNKRSSAANDDEEDDEDDEEDDAGGGSSGRDDMDRVERRREYWRDRVDRNW